MAAPTTPAAIAATLEARYPAIGERARRAAALYTTGEVHPLPRTRLLRDDRWKVHGYTASIAGKYCTCPDAEAAPQHNGGPLCEHRIAAMMQERLGGPASEPTTTPAAPASAVKRLDAIFAEARAVGAEQVRLRVRVDMTWHRVTEQDNTLLGYLFPGENRTWQEYEEAQERAEMYGLPRPFAFTLDELVRAMDAHGWRFGTKTRSWGGAAAPRLGIEGYVNEVWYILPQTERDRKFNPAIRTHIGAVTA